MEEIARTQITRRASITVCTIFITFITAVMASDLWAIFKNDSRSPAIAAENPVQQASSPFMPKWLRGILIQNRQVMNQIRQLETNLEEASPLGRTARPPVQSALAPLRESSGDVMIGKDGWLFYRPSLRFLTQAEPDWNAESTSLTKSPTNRGLNASVKAIAEFSRELSKRDIQLVIVPTWPKMSVHSQHFGTSSENKEILKPQGYNTWLRKVQSSGAMVFDPAPSILKASISNGVAYLKTDTHWNPAAMKICAEDLATYLLNNNLIQKGELKPQFTPRTISNKGDLARMMDLPIHSPLFPDEQAQLLEVCEDSGNRWLPKQDSPVLLLGDSFSNIFSLRAMGWGEDAGFSEHLGAELGMRIDTILRNSDGASATRSILSRELSRGKDRLQGKQVVVWEFAASQLTEGEWHSYPYDATSQNTAQSSYLEVEDQKPTRVTATIAGIGEIPHPQSTVYADFVGYLILDELKPTSDHASGDAPTKAIAYGLIMKNKQLTALADLRPGQTINCTLHSWTHAEGEFSRLQRSEPDDEAALQPMNWITDIELKNSANDNHANP